MVMNFTYADLDEVFDALTDLDPLMLLRATAWMADKEDHEIVDREFLNFLASVSRLFREVYSLQMIEAKRGPLAYASESLH